MSKIEFKDINGVTICPGDEILFTSAGYSSGASTLCKGKVSRFTAKTMYVEDTLYKNDGSVWYINHHKMLYDQTDWRVLVLKGEFIEYSVTKDLTNA